MTWEVRTLALLPALLKPQLHIFQNWMEGNGTLEPEKYNSTQIKPIHHPVRGLENSFSPDIARTPLPLTRVPPCNPPKQYDSQMVDASVCTVYCCLATFLAFKAKYTRASGSLAEEGGQLSLLEAGLSHDSSHSPWAATSPGPTDLL